jgi:glycosyltransferase involved in cell wall biosynthesis
MPTVDAEPQAEEWISTYQNADLVLTYSDYGVHTLRNQAGLLPNGKRKMRIFPKPMRPGVDLDTFKPMDKKEVRDTWNINPDLPVIGSVMRNQSRKLYPDLIDAFSLMKKKYKGEKQIDNSLLMVHSGWPDNMHSYDYPRHIMRLETMKFMPQYNKGIRGSIIQSLYCQTCHETSWTPAMNLYGKPIEGGRIKLPCSLCGAVDASPPTTGGGFSREQLAELYNLFDLYVQCSIAEGDGMPLQEAKACGVPTLATDYTAMREKGRYPAYSHFKELGITPDNYTCHLGGDVIEVGRYYYEPETSCRRAHPDIEDLADKMRNMLVDKDKLKKMSLDARKCVKENYDWNKLVKQWEYVLDNVKPLDRSKTWDSPIEINNPVKSIPVPEGLSNEEYINWLYLNVLKYNSVDPNGAKMWVQNLYQGVSRERMMQQFVAIGNQQSDSSRVRERVRAEVAGTRNTVDKNRHDLEFI